MRVIPKYEAFLKQFPNVKKLARAQLKDVLSQWLGLGYNRHGKNLHEGAKYIVENLKGEIPNDQKELQKILGVGPYIAGAICAFAYNQPAIFIETNIRTVFIHHFFNPQGRTLRVGISDIEILKLIEKTLPKGKSRIWYSALMDYGSYLKANGFCITPKVNIIQSSRKLKGRFASFVRKF